MTKNIYLPATILCHRPFIAGSFFEDFVKRMEDFKIWIRQNSSHLENKYFFFKLGHHYETADRMEYVKQHLPQIQSFAPKLNIIFFCNSLIEQENFKAIGQQTIFCNQNVFLRENRYAVTNQKRIYDATYVARITPIKRHALSLGIPKLLLIGDYKENEKDYAEDFLKQARKNHAVWIRKVYGIFMYRYMNRAQVGLCLSEREGAMYVSAEYALCGLPVLTTPNKGGRIVTLPMEYCCLLSEDQVTPHGVNEGVQSLIAKQYSHYEIRQAAIKLLNDYREAYYDLIHKIFTETKEGTDKDLKTALNFPHKWGLRCRVTPFFKYFRTLKIKLK